mgnify:CR=1 FL=1
MKELGSGQRTYVLGVSGTLTARQHTTVDIPFTDTAGNVIRCNYCSIRMMSATMFSKSARSLTTSS